MERRLAAILAADLVGYSKLMSEDEAGTLSTVSRLIKELVEPLIGEHRGRIVKLMGDGILVEFGSAVDAVACAIAWQETIAADSPGLQFRIGINLGDIIHQDGDIFGDGVNVASRLEGLADPGGICLSDKVHREVKSKLDLAFEDMGNQRVKNITEPIRAYRVAFGASKARAGSALALPDKPSIAVLPFDNMSGDAEQTYFSDGITEDIITTLSRTSKLFVIARNSTFVYKGRAVDVKQVARELGVRYVLEGSVRSGGSRIRITAQLIEAETGHHLWAQRYDRETGDVFALQDEITKEIVSALQVELTEGEQARASASGTKNAEAWQLAFKSRELIHAHRKDTVHQARKLLERALELDDRYAMAWGAMAEAHWKEARNKGWSTSAERSLELSVEASDRALALAPTDPGILAMRGLIMITQKDFDGALATVRQALSLAHNEANAIALASLTLFACGQAEEALRQLALAKRYCPVFPAWYPLAEARCLWLLRRYGEAETAARAASELDGAFVQPHVELAVIYAETGDDAGARDAVRQVLRADPVFSVTAFERGLPLQDPEVQVRRLRALRKSGLPD